LQQLQSKEVVRSFAVLQERCRCIEVAEVSSKGLNMLMYIAWDD